MTLLRSWGDAEGGVNEPLLARRGVSLRCQCLTAIGAEADIGRPSQSYRSGAIDPNRALPTYRPIWRETDRQMLCETSEVQGHGDSARANKCECHRAGWVSAAAIP